MKKKLFLLKIQSQGEVMHDNYSKEIDVKKLMKKIAMLLKAFYISKYKDKK